MFQHFKSILDTALDCDDYFKVALQAPGYECLSIEKIAGCPGISTSAGVARMTIIDDNYDWVCKWCYQEDALGDACERELRAYQAAEKFGVQDMFAEVRYLGEYECEYRGPAVSAWEWTSGENYKSRSYYIKMSLYGYRKAETYPQLYGSFMRLPLEVKEQLRHNKSPLAERSMDVAAGFLNEYGEELFEKLSQFCVETHINDLHCGNIGYIGDKLVLIDYAGYFEEGDSEYGSSSKNIY